MIQYESKVGKSNACNYKFARQLKDENVAKFNQSELG